MADSKSRMQNSFGGMFVVIGLLTALMGTGGVSSAQEACQSTTGPTPPPGVVCQPLSNFKSTGSIVGVPPYLWRHGCGPTAVGLVVGY